MEKYARRLLLISVGLCALGALLHTNVLSVQAREIGANPTGSSADLFCAGGRIAGNTVLTANEVCLDSSGNWIPTTSNNQTLGTASLPFSAVYAVNQTSTGSETVGTAGTMNAAGTGGTAATQSIVNGLQVFGKSAISGVVVSTTIPVNASYETVLSTGGAIVITATPSIATTTIVGGATNLPSGTYLVLTSTSSSGQVTLQDDGTLSGSKLQLGASTRAITQYKTLTLVFDATDGFWREISYGNN